RMFRSKFITIVEPGAKLVNGMDVRLLHFVEEGHNTFYVATYNKYGIENHVYKETSLMFWRCLLRVTKSPLDFRICHYNWRKECTLHPGHKRGLFHIMVFNESGEAVTASETYSSYVLRNTFFYLGRKPV
nr:hypothetical protein [Tanacetum cinerariifolium]